MRICNIAFESTAGECLKHYYFVVFARTLANVNIVWVPISRGSLFCTQQVHLQRKTAWSNTSLIGCRINCLVDLKEWHEGFVLQFHQSGKHYVEFRQVNEKRWLIMKKIAFYILERPASEGKEESEFKEDETEGLAPVEVCSFCDYTKLLSVRCVKISTISLANCTHYLYAYTIVIMFVFCF